MKTIFTHPAVQKYRANRVGTGPTFCVTGPRAPEHHQYGATAGGH